MSQLNLCTAAKGDIETAALVIGADGRHSMGARAVGAPAYNEVPPMSCWTYGYFADLEGCRARFPDLRIWSGVEAGEPHLFAASIAGHLQDAPVDRVLGSLHSLADDGRLVGVTRLLWADPAGTMSRYLAELVDMIETSDVFQVLAHCDFPRRYWPCGAHRYVEKDFEEEYRAVFRALASSGRALEINTSSPLASADQIRWFFEEGGEAVSFGSDAHQPGRVGDQFDLAVDVVEAAGFRPGRDRFDFWRR